MQVLIHNHAHNMPVTTSLPRETRMRLKVLGSAGAELPNFKPPAFLIDDELLLDAGTIGSVLTEEEQLRLKHIFITHSHLDHIRALLDNILHDLIFCIRLSFSFLNSNCALRTMAKASA